MSNLVDKNWKIKEKYPADWGRDFSNISPIVKQVLYNRGIMTKEQVEEFLNPQYPDHLHNSFLFKDMEKAVTRIWQAIDKKEKILVYGDYDADGVCSTALLVDFFQVIGVNPEIYIPHRELEGYGLNMKVATEFIKNNIDLIITVDCGTTNKEEIEKLQKAGVEVIVTDHHQVGENKANPYALINCSNPADSYPFSHLAGVGMAFKLVQALIEHAEKNKLSLNLPEGWEKWLLDLVAIATVTDVMPLVGENHTLVKYGLVVLKKSRRLGLRALAEVASINIEKINSRDLGFIIGPRLNAAGRIDHANNAYALLETKDKDTAKQYANELNQANQLRQQYTEAFLKQAKEQAKKQKENGDNILVVYSADWDLGLVGLIAGRLAENYQRPALAITENQGNIMGSGRSVAGINLVKLLQENSNFLSRFGGHTQACGFTLAGFDQLENFSKALKKSLSGLKEEDFLSDLLIDAQVDLTAINENIEKEIELLAPFGEGNPQPRFLTDNLQVIGVDFVGAKKQHMRLLVSDEHEQVRKTIGFGLGDRWGDLQMGERVDIVYEVSSNEWRGKKEQQLKIVDIKRTKNDGQK